MATRREKAKWLVKLLKVIVAKLRTDGIEGCRINDGRVEIISEVMPVQHHALGTRMEQVEPGFLGSIGKGQTA